MRSLWLTALAVTLMLDGCRGKREPEPVPGPQSALTQSATDASPDPAASPDRPDRHQRVRSTRWPMFRF
jgi:hypothetical protein